jgi:hypothetical protein
MAPPIERDRPSSVTWTSSWPGMPNGSSRRTTRSLVPGSATSVAVGAGAGTAGRPGSRVSARTSPVAGSTDAIRTCSPSCVSSWNRPRLPSRSYGTWNTPSAYVMPGSTVISGSDMAP